MIHLPFQQVNHSSVSHRSPEAQKPDFQSGALERRTFKSLKLGRTTAAKSQGKPEFDAVPEHRGKSQKQRQ
jgi:hypothetical protein